MATCSRDATISTSVRRIQLKVAFAEDNVKGSHGLDKPTGFKISANAHAFRALSSTLYSDKVKAVLREIGCNAVDAHIEAGTPELPILCKLPNELDDQFYIQDWGPGLSHEAVTGLYSTYFESTKQNRNDQTGAFGLGSKSPFSYTNSFSVVSTHGSKKRTYSLHLDNRGAPAVSLMAEEDADADWAHGVRVGFSVKPDDYREFQTKAQSVFQWFAVAPVIRGSTPITTVQYEYRDSNYRLLADKALTGRVPVLIMGGVAYPLTMASVGVAEVYGGDETFLSFARHMTGLVLPVAIGDVEVSLSRESLQYSPDSVRAIKAKLEAAVEHMGRKVVMELDRIDSGGWVEICQATDLIERMMPGSSNWNFQQLGRLLGIDKIKAEAYQKYIQREMMEVPYVKGHKSAIKMVTRVKYDKGPRVFLHDPGSHGYSRKSSVHIVSETVIAHGPQSHAVTRAKMAVASGLYRQVILVTNGQTLKPTAAEAEADATALSKLMRGIPTIGIDDLPKHDVVRRPGRKKKKGWAPTLPLGVSVKGFKVNESTTDVIENWPATYMCDGPSGRRSTHYVRLYDKTVKLDDKIAYVDWSHTWGSYTALMEEIGIAGVDSYVLAPAATVRACYLKELGWTHATEEIKKYLARKDVRDAIRSRIRRHNPAVPEHEYHCHGWMSRMSYVLFKQKVRPDMMALLSNSGLWATLEGMFEARRLELKSSAQAAGKLPKALEQYRNLTRSLKDAQVDDTLKMEDGITVADLDASFASRFPRSSVVDASDFYNYYKADEADAVKLLEFVLSKES